MTENDEDRDNPMDELSEMMELPDEEGDDDVIDTPDGGALVTLDEEEEPGESEHFANLAEAMPESELDRIATSLLEQIDRDRESRKDRDKLYAEGLRRTGLGDEAPGGADFDGASRAVHPLLSEAAVDFSARVMKEIFPSSGPVKTHIPGTPTKKRLEKAERKKKHMNHQLLHEMEEFRAELEQLLTQIPLGGVGYLKMYHDARMRRPRSEFVPVDDILLPFSAANFASSDRKTHQQQITRLEYKRRTESGVYRDVDMTDPMSIDVSASQKAADRIEGRKEDAFNEDGLRRIFEVYTYLDVEEDDTFSPYIVTIDETTEKVLALYRNWAPDDELRKEIKHFSEWNFLPWRGAQGVGLTHLIGGLSAAATGALRALLDSAHINNMPTMIKLAGGTKGGQNIDLNPTEVVEIEGAFNVDDIRKLMMPVPFNQPSPVLMELLGFITEAAKGVVRTSLDMVAEQKQDMPVGTTLAVIEQGLVVFSSIHQRMHAAMGETLRILHRINRDYLEEERQVDEDGEIIARRADYDGPMDVIPVSDPQIFTEVQRQAQIAMIAQRAALLPQLYNLHKVEERILEFAKIPGAKDLLVPAPQPQLLNPVNENLAATMGRPIVVFPEQDHLAHIDAHLQYLQHPLFGGSAAMQQQVAPAMLAHLKDHLAFWYVTEVFNITTEAAGIDADKLFAPDDPEITKVTDQLMAQASHRVLQSLSGDQQHPLNGLPPVIQQLVEFVQQNQPPGPMDPAQVQAQEVQRKSAADQQNAQIKMQELGMRQQETQQQLQLKMQEMAAKNAEMQAASALEREKMNAEYQREMAKMRADMERMRMDMQRDQMKITAQAQVAEGGYETTIKKTMMDNEAKMQINREDNAVAMQIAAAEIESGQKSALENGNGFDPGS